MIRSLFILLTKVRNLVTNGAFHNDITGWSAVNSSVPAWSAGQMLVSGPAVFPGAGQIVQNAAGNVLEITANYTLAGTSANVYINAGTGAAGLQSAGTIGSKTGLAALSSGTITATYTTTTSTTAIVFLFNAVGGGYIDNVVVRRR
jgi:hypothetical protein